MGWWPAAQWQRMWDGEDCDMCGDASLPSNPFGDLLVETPWSYVRLGVNQTHAGYSVVIAKRHAPELHHLTTAERAGFWDDVATIGQVVTDQLQPVKLANLSMGFRMPHVHCHVLPQYEDDDPFGPLDPQAGNVRLSPAAWAERMASLRTGFLTASIDAG